MHRADVVTCIAMASIRPLRRVLIANRGEIAVRVMRTCRERGVETVAVYSEVDRRALHVQLADRAIAIGAATNYLLPDAVIAACRASGADAVHPGYGFLSENAHFAAACAEAGIAFIGPSPEAIRRMGNKTEARTTATAAGIAVVPGDSGSGGLGFTSADLAVVAARNVGFPVLIKAVSGGGGKGMRLVAAEADFASAFDAARREATAAFGDPTLYLEKAIERPRHIEIQVFGDHYGAIVHLGERDCSVQRRHQKVIEETPSPAVTPELRSRLGVAAVAAARAVGYVGAGTCEFLLGDDGQFYFLEMNTRLQVEHPITEMLYGVDLVSWQLDVAEARPLPLSQAELDARRRGHAVECRICAEDPVRFLPSPGKITHLRVPGGPYVRNDSGYYEGAEVPIHYDSMISKLVVWGEDRPRALARMRSALDEYRVGGIQTNLPFHRRCVRHRAFIDGNYDTGFIGRHAAELVLDADPADLEAATLAAAVDHFTAPSAELQRAHSASTGEISGWRRRM